MKPHKGAPATSRITVKECRDMMRDHTRALRLTIVALSSFTVTILGLVLTQ